MLYTRNKYCWNSLTARIPRSCLTGVMLLPLFKKSTSISLYLITTAGDSLNCNMWNLSLGKKNFDVPSRTTYFVHLSVRVESYFFYLIVIQWDSQRCLHPFPSWHLHRISSRIKGLSFEIRPDFAWTGLACRANSKFAKRNVDIKHTLSQRRSQTLWAGEGGRAGCLTTPMFNFKIMSWAISANAWEILINFFIIFSVVFW